MGRGNDAINVFVDRMSKIWNARAQSKATAPGCTEQLVSNIVEHAGVPRAVVEGQRWAQSCQMSSACHPQTDGLTDRVKLKLQLLKAAFQERAVFTHSSHKPP